MSRESLINQRLRGAFSRFDQPPTRCRAAIGIRFYQVQLAIITPPDLSRPQEFDTFHSVRLTDRGWAHAHAGKAGCRLGKQYNVIRPHRTPQAPASTATPGSRFRRIETVADGHHVSSPLRQRLSWVSNAFACRASRRRFRAARVCQIKVNVGHAALRNRKVSREQAHHKICTPYRSHH